MIQTKIREKLAESNPDVYWWLKGDGTEGLWQSASGEWAGDVDLNDGKLQQQYCRYKLRMEEIDSIGLNKPLAETRSKLSHELVVVRNDPEFVFQGVCLYNLFANNDRHALMQNYKLPTLHMKRS